MRVSLEWLRVFVDPPSVGELCDHLRRAGIEVESIDDPASRSKGVVIGEVLTHGPHPNADKLSVCTVTDGTETHAVVCGAPNVAAGQKIVLARVGASLAGGSLSIGAREVRGVASRGMICSRAELGLEAKSGGIWVLPADAPLGKDPFTALGIEPALELSITPNRPDLLSHLGIAREIAAATGQRLRYGDWRLSEKGPPVQTRVKIADSAGCPRYIARVIQGIEIGPSPAWLRERLERVGQRSVNNVVDATNYVLFELGQPLHAFDISRLAGESNQPTLPTIHVRRAAAGEKLTTLDDVDRALDPHDLVIADPARVLALAGVMGGADSEVGPGTKAVLLESATFDPITVRRTAKRHGLSTESSRRFERGVDPGITMRAADRCAQLIAEIAGGQVAKGVVEVAAKVPPAPEIALRHERVERLLGVELLPEKVVELLEPLEIRCVRRNDMVLHFQPPTFRRDLEREADVIEEVARRHGYDAIPERLPDAGGDYVYREAPARANDTARNALMAVGLSEVCTFGFGSPAAYAPFAGREGEPVMVMNPLGEELSALRTTLLPGLFSVAGRNQRHGNTDVRIFEIGTTFHRRDGLLTGRAATSSQGEDARDQGLPREDLRVGILETGGRFGGRWFEAGQKIDFTDLRGTVEALVEAFAPRADLRFEAAPFEGMSPYASAAVFLGETPLGYAAQLHPVRAGELELEGAVFVAELDLGLLRDAEVRRVQHRSLPKFPGTRRDVAVIADRSVPAQSIVSYLRANAGGALGPGVVEDVRVFDVYRGKPIPDDKVSLAFAIDYRSPERTLTDDEVGAAFDGVLAGLKSELGVEIR